MGIDEINKSIEGEIEIALGVFIVKVDGINVCTLLSRIRSVPKSRQ